ncbi:MAG: hypothetical protein B7X08_01645 [Acidocella sp. 20-63-7]|nr:MAG: hypothetical protein B7X08_01645 [Acidocella sp. 20-63-7]HQT47106.1 hypothetical protein [Acidocella sp.]
MFDIARHSRLALVLCFAGFLPACGAKNAALDVATRATAARPHFSLDTPVAKIAADQRGKAVLDRDIPKLMANRSYPMFEDMSLDQIASVSGGQLTRAKLDLLQADLAQISTAQPTTQ